MIAITTAMPPFMPTLTEDQSIVERKSQLDFSWRDGVLAVVPLRGSKEDLSAIVPRLRDEEEVRLSRTKEEASESGWPTPR